MEATGVNYPNIIAVTAPSRRSGKGTITNVLVSGYGYTELAYAMPIKCMFLALCLYQGVDQSWFPRILNGDLKETPIDEVAGLSLRTFAEGVGTDWGRKMYDTDMWVKMARKKIEKSLEQGQRVVVSDVRFPNECDVVRSLGGQVWSVTRPVENGGLAPTLASEGHLSDYPMDCYFRNGRTVDDLEADVRHLMRRFE